MAELKKHSSAQFDSEMATARLQACEKRQILNIIGDRDGNNSYSG